MAPPLGSSTNTDHDLNCLTIMELEMLAHDRMDKQTRDYYNEGADSGSTLRENMTAYNKYRIRPRVLRDVSRIDTTVPIFGQRNSVPLGIAPTAMQRLAHSEGEEATARACADRNVIMGLSSFATTSLEDVAAASGDNAHVLATDTQKNTAFAFAQQDGAGNLIAIGQPGGFDTSTVAQAGNGDAAIVTQSGNVNASTVTGSSTKHWYFVSSVEAWAPKNSSALIILGEKYILDLVIGVCVFFGAWRFNEAIPSMIARGCKAATARAERVLYRLPKPRWTLRRQ